jgi:hypothetical protein
MRKILYRFIYLPAMVCGLLSFAGCREELKLNDVQVVCQRYEGTALVPINPQSRYLRVMEDWQKRLDKAAPRLGEMAVRCPMVENTSPRGLVYEYHTAWDDTVAGNAVLYYFAFIPHPKVYAGYGIDAVISAKENKLKQLCVFPVPLE